MTRINVFLILLGLIWMPFALYSTLVFSTDMLKLACNALILFLVLGVLGFAGVNSLVVREYEIVGLGATNLALVISAFADLEKELEDQTTHCEILR